MGIILYKKLCKMPGRVIYEKLMKNYKQYLIDDKSEKSDGKINNKNGKNKKHNNGNKNKNKFGGNKKNK